MLGFTDSLRMISLGHSVIVRLSVCCWPFAFNNSVILVLTRNQIIIVKYNSEQAVSVPDEKCENIEYNLLHPVPVIMVRNIEEIKDDYLPNTGYVIKIMFYLFLRERERGRDKKVRMKERGKKK